MGVTEGRLAIKSNCMQYMVHARKGVHLVYIIASDQLVLWAQCRGVFAGSTGEGLRIWDIARKAPTEMCIYLRWGQDASPCTILYSRTRVFKDRPSSIRIKMYTSLAMWMAIVRCNQSYRGRMHKNREEMMQIESENTSANYPKKTIAACYNNSACLL